MNPAHVAITTDLDDRTLTIVCFLTDDRQIDSGVRPYLERYGVQIVRYVPHLVGSQLLEVVADQSTLRDIEELLKTYYESCGKEPSIAPIGDIIR